jgi:hypothetical protein
MSVQDYRGTGEKVTCNSGMGQFFFLFQLNALMLNTFKIFVFNILMYVFNTLCAFCWNTKKKLAARMHGVESFKKI